VDALGIDLGRDASQPDAPAPDISLPDIAVPDRAIPDIEVPDSAAPDSLSPDLGPDAAVPDLCYCGNNVINCTEVCDGYAVNKKTCADFGYSSSGILNCASNCKAFDTRDCFSFPDTKGLRISTHTSSDDTPQVAYNKASDSWLVAWVRSNHINTAVVDKSGSVTSAKVIVTNARQFALVADGSDYLLAYFHFTTLSKGLYFARLNPTTGSIKSGSKTLLVNNLTTLARPHIARIGTTWLVAYQEGSAKAVAQRVSTSGSAPAAVGAKIEIAPATASTPNLQALGTDGVSWLALWRQGAGSGSKYDLYARHIHINASMSTPVAVAKTTKINEHYASMVHTVGSRYLVTWVASTPKNVTPYKCDVMAMLLDAKTPTITTGTPLTVFKKCGDFQGTASSYDGDKKTYLSIFGWDFNGGDIKAQRFGPDPATGVLRLEETSPRLISTAAYQQHNAQAAFGSKHHLIVWGDKRLSSHFDIYAARYR